MALEIDLKTADFYQATSKAASLTVINKCLHHGYMLLCNYLTPSHEIMIDYYKMLLNNCLCVSR